MTVPKPDVTLTEALSSYYPFSTDYTASSYVPVTPGYYSFEITMCDLTFVVNFEHGDYGVEPYTYKAEEACGGLRFYPLGSFLKNGQQLSTEYIMVDAPPGVSRTSVFDSAVDTIAKTGYFLLPASVAGHYAFARRQFPYGCYSLDTLHFDYAREVFDLDSLSVYACAVGTMPLFYVKAKNGFTPYTYELYENGSLVASNASGEFIYGDALNTYAMRIIDACGTSFWVDLSVIDLGRTNHAVNGSDTVCVGETIQLNCISLGASEFLWKGPAGFTSNEQFASVPNVTTAHSGSYVLTFQPAGCGAPVTQTLNVTVYVPPPPVCDTLHFCLHGGYSFDGIGVLPNHALIWYAADGVTVCPPPTLNTGQVHEEVFYVAQQHIARGCIGEKQKLILKVNALPSPPSPVDTVHFCRNGGNTLPVITASAGHTLVWYTNDGVECAPPAVSTLFAHEERYYIAQRGGRWGCESEKTPVVIKVNEPPRVAAGTLHFCLHGDNALSAIVPLPTYALLWYAADSTTACPPPDVPTHFVHEERYYVAQRGGRWGCESEKAPVVIKVNEPPPPLSVDTVRFCVNDNNTLPVIATLPNHTLLWYAADGITACSPPVVYTATPHREMYYVAQRHNISGCESPKEELIIDVLALPSPDITATAAQVCVNAAPVIDIYNTIAGYTYDIYANPQAAGLLYSATGTGGNVSAPLPVTIAENTAFYIRVNTPNCSARKLKMVIVPVKIVTIMPSNLPPYRKNEWYAVQLHIDSYAQQFTLVEGMLPAGMSLGLSGLLSGVVPLNEPGRMTPFTVQAVDADGCAGARRYVLPWEYSAPSVFTPNGDGINDIFMRGHRVTIFDRRGIIIYEGEDGWDGTYHNKPAPPDIYFYKVARKVENGDEEIKTGYIGLER
jgi:gliding motility-associated-like protein